MHPGKKRLITLEGTIKACFYAVIYASLLLGAEAFHWDWRRAEELKSTQSLRHAKVTRIERAAIARGIANQLRPEMPDLGIETEEQLEDVALDTRVKMVDLNADGIPEVIAQGMGEHENCSPTGNCPFWIFQKSNHEYTPLFSVMESVQTFTIQPSRTNGFSDIVIETQFSADQCGISLLRYSEGRYDYAGCWVAYWSVQEGDTVRQLKEPRLLPCEERIR
ncbi:MAG: hypothetical protein P4N24_14205 [Acidobacteriota bacterium]|nr:hypothetical protein [Acidobacteriota bacterium]